MWFLVVHLQCDTSGSGANLLLLHACFIVGKIPDFTTLLEFFTNAYFSLFSLY